MLLFLRIFLFTILFHGYTLVADEVYQNDLSFPLPIHHTYEYKICKRPLSIGFDKSNTSFFDAFDFEFLENENLNTQHFQFFKVSNSFSLNDNSYFNNSKIKNDSVYFPEYIPKNVKKPYVNQECYDNNFSNFGFFDDSKIHCNEDQTLYHICSTQTFNYDEIQAAMGVLLVNFIDVKYDLSIYNCQSFTKSLLKVLKQIQTNGPACMPIVYSQNKSLLNRLITAYLNQSNQSKNWLLHIDSLKWQNMSNQCSVYQSSP